MNKMMFYWALALLLVIMPGTAMAGDSGFSGILGLTGLSLLAFAFPTVRHACGCSSNDDREPLVVRNEHHSYSHQHVYHHNFNYKNVTEGFETINELPDGRRVHQRHIKKWS